MKKWILPLIVFLLGLIIADVFFGVDIEELIDGALDFILGILKGADSQ